MIFNGKVLAQNIKEKVGDFVKKNFTNENAPCLACIIVGNDKASQIYVNSKKAACEECGIRSLIYNMPENTSKSSLIEFIETLNKNNKISGILLQLPLPNHLKDAQNEIINSILPSKDVDCLTELNLGKLFSGTGKIAPCTATGISEILKSANVLLDGKKVCVIGRSLLVGKSVAMLLQNENATVTACHSHTKNLENEVSQADIVVVAVGKPKMITANFIKPGAVIVDVGINRTEKGIVGDVDFESVKDKCSLITPVPGGVGPLTVACLMENTLILHTLANKNIKN